MRASEEDTRDWDRIFKEQALKEKRPKQIAFEELLSSLNKLHSVVFGSSHMHPFVVLRTRALNDLQNSYANLNAQVTAKLQTYLEEMVKEAQELTKESEE